MPEINGTELILQKITAVETRFADLKAERETYAADKAAIDKQLGELKTELTELKKKNEQAAQLRLPGVEYGSKGEADKPTWTRMLQAVTEPERLKLKEYGPEKEMIDYARHTAINAGTGASGGFLVPTTLRQGIVPELRERSIARLLGATVISNLSPGAHQWAKSKGGITAVHLNTEGEESGTESVPTFDLITTQPRTAAIFVPMTRGMMTQSAEAIEPWVRGEVAKLLALFQDKQFFVGTGTAGAPRGIFNHPSVGTFAFAESSISAVWQSLIDAVLDVRTAQALDLDGLGWACEPAVRFWLAKILDLNGRPLFDSLMSGDFAKTNIMRQIMSYPLFDSAQIVNASAATANLMYGPWSSGVIAEWSTLELVLNTESDTNFLKARGTVRGIFDYDCAFFQAQAFTKGSGVDTTAAIPVTL